MPREAGLPKRLQPMLATLPVHRSLTPGECSGASGMGFNLTFLDPMAPEARAPLAAQEAR
jgi:hypothetical protein